MARPRVDLSTGLTLQEYRALEPELDRPLTLWGLGAKFHDVRPTMSLRSGPTTTGRGDAWMYA